MNNRNEKWSSGPVPQFHLRHLGPLADRVEDLFLAHGVSITRTSELGQLLRAGRDIAAIADIPETVSVNQFSYYDSFSLSRLAKSVIFLDYRPEYRQYFRDLGTGSLNFWNSEQSKAKDVEWELLLWSHLNRIFPGCARLAEPDIRLTLAHKEIGIACKRVYSFKRVQDQIRAGANQLRRNGIGGIVALAFDPYGGNQNDYCLMRAPSLQAASEGTFRYFSDIWKSIARDSIRKYLKPNKVIGLIIAVQGFIQLVDTQDITEYGAVRLQTYPGSTRENQEVMDILHRAGTANPSPFESEVLSRLDRLKEFAQVLGRK
jgi:hypothetical protein